MNILLIILISLLSICCAYFIFGDGTILESFLNWCVSNPDKERIKNVRRYLYLEFGLVAPANTRRTVPGGASLKYPSSGHYKVFKKGYRTGRNVKQ